MDSALICLAQRCDEPAPGPEFVCMAYDSALRLRAVRGRLVTVAFFEPGATYMVDLEDVCAHGRRSLSGKCWCVPISLAIRRL